MPGAVDVALHDVSAQPAVQRRGPFEVHVAADTHTAQARPVQRLLHHIGGELAVCLHLDHRQADAVDGDGVAVPGVRGDDGSADDEPRRIGEVFLADDFAKLFDDSGEHAKSGYAAPPSTMHSCRRAQKTQSDPFGQFSPHFSQP